jgi:hypothetical protein
LIALGEDLPHIRKKISGSRTTKIKATEVGAIVFHHGSEPISNEEAAQIAKRVGYGTKASYVQNIRYEYLDWLAREGKHQSLHIEELKKLANTFSLCIKDTREYELPDNRLLLEVDGIDWRLDPMMWFYLCTPDFEPMGKWGDLFPNLKEHLGQNPFWEHYEVLKNKADQLDSWFRLEVGKLGPEFHSRKDIWDELEKAKRDRRLNLTWYPSVFPNARPDERAGFEPGYDSTYADALLDLLGGNGLNPEIQMFELETLLVEMKQDLSVERMLPMIEESHCKDCPSLLILES